MFGDRFWRLLVLTALLFAGGCSLKPPVATPAPAPTAPPATFVASISAVAGVDDPSPPGGLGNSVESFSRTFGRPTAAFAVNQASYAYGEWPVRGLYVILDDSLRRAREVRVNFGKPLPLAEAQRQARAYLPADAKLARTVAEPATGDSIAEYTSERLAAVFPSLQPPGSFAVIYDGQSDQITGVILQIGW